MPCTSSPLHPRPKSQSSAQPEIMLCRGRFQKGRPFLVLIWIFALLQIFSNSQFGLFRPHPTHHCLPNSWNVREISRVVVCQIGRLPANCGAPGIPTRWACATQPGLPPLRAQFRLGISSDWSSSLFPGLGEFVWCEHVGFFNNKKFRLGISTDWSSSLFLGLGYRGGPRGFWGHPPR